MESLPYLKEIELKRKTIDSFDVYPFSIPAVKELDFLEFDKEVTIFVGENGSGKSTLLEAIAVGLGFNAEGGSKNFHFGTRSTHSELHNYLRFSKSFKRYKDGFFLRAESFYNVATNIDELDEAAFPYIDPPAIKDSYGGKSLHHQSHGESFLSLMIQRFSGDGLYILDEPEAALSPTRQLAIFKQNASTRDTAVAVHYGNPFPHFNGLPRRQNLSNRQVGTVSNKIPRYRTL
ncbi:DNA replication and repair protein RecF [Marinomonas spartinae]|uniref:AAA family ATPase n=1 Tax=Marinomonas spartinae TaxID=1792290 RepID=UPI000808F98D|nr:AAA family ATPase [Marinomonas spartinae]SBS39252.1 DNA replication and repair protein RecF [Marinomonas spartinae]